MCCFRSMPIFMPRPMHFGYYGNCTPFWGCPQSFHNSFAWGAGFGLGMGAAGLICKVLDRFI